MNDDGELSVFANVSMFETLFLTEEVDEGGGGDGGGSGGVKGRALRIVVRCEHAVTSASASNVFFLAAAMSVALV